jgi:hypothetical protein
VLLIAASLVPDGVVLHEVITAAMAGTLEPKTGRRKFPLFAGAQQLTFPLPGVIS